MTYDRYVPFLGDLVHTELAPSVAGAAQQARHTRFSLSHRKHVRAIEIRVPERIEMGAAGSPDAGRGLRLACRSSSRMTLKIVQMRVE